MVYRRKTAFFPAHVCIFVAGLAKLFFCLKRKICLGGFTSRLGFVFSRFPLFWKAFLRESGFLFGFLATPATICQSVESFFLRVLEKYFVEVFAVAGMFLFIGDLQKASKPRSAPLLFYRGGLFKQNKFAIPL